MLKYGCFLVAFVAALWVRAQGANDIDHFIVRENLIKNGKLAIIATDTEEHPNEAISGTYQFVINGFKQELKFHQGVSVTANPVEASAFVFIKHRNQQGSHGRLYYVLKRGQHLNPVAINWYFLILVPAAILLIAYLFKRIMALAIVVLVALFIYNYHKGLDLENIFETVSHGVMSLVASR